MSESRILRVRQGNIADRLDRIVEPTRGSSARMVGQVFAVSSVPTTTGKYFAVHPVSVGGTEAEGSAGVLSADTNATAYVLVLGSTVPVAGDYLVAKEVNGRWVAQTRGTVSVPVTSCITCNAVLPPLKCMDSLYGGPFNFTGSFLPTPNPGLTAHNTITFTGSNACGSGTTSHESVDLPITYVIHCSPISAILQIFWPECDPFGEEVPSPAGVDLGPGTLPGLVFFDGATWADMNCSDPTWTFIVPQRTTRIGVRPAGFPLGYFPYDFGATITVTKQ